MSLQIADSGSGSGLLVAETHASNEAVARLLRAYDSSLRLVPQAGEEHGGVLWNVYRYNGPDRPASYVCAWQTPGGEPLPLSSRLLEKVQYLDRRTVGDAPSAEAMNAAHKQKLRKDRIAEKQEITEAHEPYVRRGRVSVSTTAARNRKPEWQRTRRPAVEE